MSRPIRGPGQQDSLNSCPMCLHRKCFSLVLGLMFAMAQASEPAPVAEPVAITEPVPAPVVQTPAVVPVVLQTSLGAIRIAVEVERAPVTAANFLRYVDNKRFDGVNWYRALKLDPEGRYGLVQAGLRGDRKRLFKPIAHEAPFVTGLSHVDGAVSMARLAPGTATADFFVVIGDLVSLDGKPDSDDPGASSERNDPAQVDGNRVKPEFC